MPSAAGTGWSPARSATDARRWTPWRSATRMCRSPWSGTRWVAGWPCGSVRKSASPTSSRSRRGPGGESSSARTRTCACWSSTGRTTGSRHRRPAASSSSGFRRRGSTRSFVGLRHEKHAMLHRWRTWDRLTAGFLRRAFSCDRAVTAGGVVERLGARAVDDGYLPCRARVRRLGQVEPMIRFEVSKRVVSGPNAPVRVVIPNRWRAVIDDPFVPRGWWQAAALERRPGRLGGRL